MLNTSITRLNNNDQALTSLDLGYNKIGDKGASLLEETLKKPRSFLYFSSRLGMKPIALLLIDLPQAKRPQLPHRGLDRRKDLR